MSSIYVISYLEHSQSMSGSGIGSKTIKGYFESKYDADKYIENNPGNGYGEYICTVVNKLTHNNRG